MAVKLLSDRQDTDKIQPGRTIRIVAAGEDVVASNTPRKLSESGAKPTKTVRVIG